MNTFYVFLALAAVASAQLAQSECRVATSGVYRSFDGTNVRGRFSTDCVVPLAASDCGNQTWLVTLNRANSVFSIRYQGQTTNLVAGQRIGFPEVIVAVAANGNTAAIRVPSPANSINCAVCSAPGIPTCVRAQAVSRNRRSLPLATRPSSSDVAQESAKDTIPKKEVSRRFLDYFTMGKQFMGEFF